MAASKLPKLPRLLAGKIYKTGQTRGADDDVVFQNRVGRNSTVLIPYAFYNDCKNSPDEAGLYEKGFIVLISPEFYYGDKGFQTDMVAQGLYLGRNALLFYETRKQWNDYNPEEKGLNIPDSRTTPLGGEYVARVPSTTAAKDEKISRGYNNSGLKGAGIRVYEYASLTTLKHCRIQLEMVFWMCVDAKEVMIVSGMSEIEIDERRAGIIASAKSLDLMDIDRLIEARILNPEQQCICPLCLEPVSANGFINRLEQAPGRAVPDLTVTQINLFHINELRTGQFNHTPYNLGWGHHHCNVVVKDAGISETLVWMESVVARNTKLGFDFG